MASMKIDFVLTLAMWLILNMLAANNLDTLKK